MRIEKKRGWILIEFDSKEEMQNLPIQVRAYRMKFVKYPKQSMCQRTDWTDSGIYWYDESWDWAKWYTNELKQIMEEKQNV